MKRRLRIIISIIIAIVVVIEVASYLAEGPLRRYAEQTVNGSLEGFTTHINKLTLHPFRLSMNLDNVRVYQNAYPDRPIADIRRLHEKVHFLRLLTARIVIDLDIDRPEIYADFKNLAKAAAKAPSKKGAWQDTVESLPPATINRFRIESGKVTVVDAELLAVPVTISAINMVVRNVRNRVSHDPYPSSVEMDGLLLNSGRIQLKGHADFLARPLAAIIADASLDGMDLTRFRTIAERYHVSITKGTLTTSEFVEFSPTKKIFTIKDLTVRDPEIDFVYLGPSPAKKPPKKLPVAIKAEKVRIINGNFGLVNKTKNPPYRVFIKDADINLANISNEFTEGPGELRMSGKFMGSGETTASASFRSEANGPDFNLAVAIKNTKMTDMNNVFRAYGKFDVARGFFSFYSELTVKGDKITGYVKPLFRDMKVYDKRKDEDKTRFKQLYEKALSGVAKLLENRPRKAVATKTPISGKIEKPRVGTWETIGNLFENAFIRAILPGFEKNIK